MDPEQYSSMLCFAVFLFIGSDFNFTSAFITKQKSIENPCNKSILYTIYGY